MSASTRIGRSIDELATSMTRLRGSLTGIPFGRRGFVAQYDQLARDVARLALTLQQAEHQARLAEEAGRAEARTRKNKRGRGSKRAGAVGRVGLAVAEARTVSR